MKKPEVIFDGLTVAVYFEKKQIISEDKIECGLTPTGRTRYQTKYIKEYVNKAPDEFLSFIIGKGLIPSMLHRKTVMHITDKQFSIEIVKQNLSPVDNPEYAVMYNIRSALGYLVTILCCPRKKLNSYNLVKFHGLLFSDLSYNPMRQHQKQLLTNIRQFVDCKENRASVSKIDVALDFYHEIPYLEIRQQMICNHRAYCSGYVVKDSKKHQDLQPYMKYANGIYWGFRERKGSTSGRSKVLLYVKSKCPNQDIFTKDNQLKNNWYRLELRLRKTAAKNHGKKLLFSNNLAADIAALMPKFLDFHEYKEQKNRQQWYQELLDNLLY